MAAGKIFLCYRREDSAGHAGRIYDRLNQRFPGRVFMDVAGIGVGTRWAEVIEQTLGACEVAVILIGRRWLERSPAGTRRIDGPDDSLRAEITTALRLKLKIVPLLVGGAALPEHDDLPREVGPIVDWQALRIDDDDFDHDSSRLVAALEQQLHDEGADPHLDSAGAKHAEIRRLLASAESCIARGDWVTAAQTLQSLLSLDKTHAEATARLRFVQQQSTRAYTLPVPPLPPQGRAGRWVSFGADTGPAQDEPATTPDASSEAPAPSLAGDYELASYAEQGVLLPLSGAMRLVPVSDRRFQFEAAVGSFQYRGYFEGQGSNWTTTTLQTNDSRAVAGPIPTQVSFDGVMLVMQNSYGQSAVWSRLDHPLP